MPAIKPLSQIVDKWSRRASVAGPDYEAGVRQPKQDWATATAEAADRYSQGVQEAIANDAFSKGVEDAGTSRWQQGAVSKGVQRFAPGVNLAKPRYQEKMSKVHAVIQATTLPPPGPRGSDQNIERVRAMNRALREAKLSGQL